MTLQRALMVLFLTAFAALSGCGESTHYEPGLQPASAEQGTWVVTGVTVAGKAHSLVKDSEIRLRFEGDQLTVTAGCNTMSGKYELDGSRLLVDGLATTDMGCDADLMAQDAWVGALFAKPSQLNTGSGASLISGGTVLSIADRKTVSPDKPLVGPTWVLDTIGGGPSGDGAVSSVPEGEHATLRIEGDSVHVFDGCNSRGGAVTITDSTIEFGNLSSTLKDCGFRDVERAVDAVLQGTVSYEIEEDRLTVIGTDNRLLGFRAS